MEINLLEIFQMEKNQMENFIFLMEIYMKDNSIMIKKKDKEYFCLKMEKNMKVILKMI
jgi:hypothetical protein